MFWQVVLNVSALPIMRYLIRGIEDPLLIHLRVCLDVYFMSMPLLPLRCGVYQ